MITQEDLYGEMTAADVRAALDDARTGSPDVDAWEALVKMSAGRVENALGGVVTPAVEAPAEYAQNLFILEALYTRRGFYGRENPFAERAKDAEKRLRDLVSGADAPAIDGTGAIVTDDLRATPRIGLMA